jgi:hypothetical protein
MLKSTNIPSLLAISLLYLMIFLLASCVPSFAKSIVAVMSIVMEIGKCAISCQCELISPYPFTCETH